jgi:hypothetical protein
VRTSSNRPLVYSSTLNEIPCKLPIEKSFTTDLGSIYQPLEESHIRLLIVISIDSTPDCGIQSFPKSRVQGAYDALTYTWGNAPATAKIHINNKTFLVTPRLYEILRQLYQRSKKASANVLVWIDAIFLNQTDNSEKNVQVPLMNEVFGQVRQVLVWQSSIAIWR